MNEEAIKKLIDAIIEDEDYDRIYTIYDGGEVGDLHELWLACCRFQKNLEALKDYIAP